MTSLSSCAGLTRASVHLREESFEADGLNALAEELFAEKGSGTTFPALFATHFGD
jgi:hypothetical protein